MPTVEELQAKVAELEAALTEKTAEVQEAKTELAKQAEAARMAEIKELSTTCGAGLSEEQVKMFAAMPQDQFAAVAATMKELAEKAQSHKQALFQQQVTGGNEQPAKPTTLSLSDHYALRKKFEQGA